MAETTIVAALRAGKKRRQEKRAARRQLKEKSTNRGRAAPTMTKTSGMKEENRRQGTSSEGWTDDKGRKRPPKNMTPQQKVDWYRSQYSNKAKSSEPAKTTTTPKSTKTDNKTDNKGGGNKGGGNKGGGNKGAGYSAGGALAKTLKGAKETKAKLDKGVRDANKSVKGAQAERRRRAGVAAEGAAAGKAAVDNAVKAVGDSSDGTPFYLQKPGGGKEGKKEEKKGGVKGGSSSNKARRQGVINQYATPKESLDAKRSRQEAKQKAEQRRKARSINERAIEQKGDSPVMRD